MPLGSAGVPVLPLTGPVPRNPVVPAETWLLKVRPWLNWSDQFVTDWADWRCRS